MSVPADLESQHRIRRRNEIVAVATRLFAELGYNACEMDRVSNELQIAKGTLYLYFPGKQSLFFACVDHGMQELQATLQAVLEQDDDPFRCTAKSIWAFLQFFDQHPEHIELLIQERAIFRDRAQPTFFVYRNARRARWRDIYQQMIDSGRLRNDLSVDDLLDAMSNVLYGAIFTNYFAGLSVPLCQQYRALVELTFRGVLSDAERQRLGNVSPADWNSTGKSCVSPSEFT